jgi:hypothetical protein
MILKEIGKLGIKIVNGDSNKIIISPEDFKRFWKKVNEFTSSSMSGVHYGHYKAAIQDPQTSQDAKVDLKALIVAVMPIYCLSETINLFFFLFLCVFNKLIIFSVS